jgi:hypothetical protein
LLPIGCTFQDDHRAFRRQLEDKRPVIENNLLSGRQYIANEPPLSDTSDSEGGPYHSSSDSLNQWFSNWVPRKTGVQRISDENLGISIFFNYIYLLPIIVLNYEYKVIFENKWIKF